MHTDIIQQREVEGELRESNEEVQRYAYIVSHDLRAPLVNVMGFASELATVQADVKEALEGHPQQARIHKDLDEALGFITADNDSTNDIPLKPEGSTRHLSLSRSNEDLLVGRRDDAIRLGFHV